MLSQSFMKIKFADLRKTVLTNKNPTDIIKVQSNLTLKFFLRRKIRKYLHKRYNRAEMFRCDCRVNVTVSAHGRFFI